MKGVYCIKHIDSGRMYIGSSDDIYRRLQEHTSALNRSKEFKTRHHNKYLQNAWDKYGEDSFSVSVILEMNDNSTIDEIREQEQKLIELYWDSGILFNLTKTAKSPLDDPNVKEARKKAHAEYYSKPENIEKVRRMFASFREDPIMYQKMLDNHRKTIDTPTHRKMLSDNQKQVASRPGYKEHHSERLKQKWATDEVFRTSVLAALEKGRASPTIKENRSKGVSKEMKRRWSEDQEFIDKMNKGKYVWSNKPVRRLDTGEEFPSTKIASESVGLNRAAVSCAINRGTRCAGTYWQYVKKENT